MKYNKCLSGAWMYLPPDCRVLDSQFPIHVKLDGNLRQVDVAVPGARREEQRVEGAAQHRAEGRGPGARPA
jgi:hypothetical protein